MIQLNVYSLNCKCYITTNTLLSIIICILSYNYFNVRILPQQILHGCQIRLKDFIKINAIKNLFI